MVANALCYSAYLIVSKPLARRYPPLVVIAWREALAPAPGNPAVWWALAYIIVFPTVVAYLLNMYALARVRASTTAVYVYAQPLITGLASWLAFGETPSGGMLLAAAGLFLGIWLVARRRSRRPRELSPAREGLHHRCVVGVEARAPHARARGGHMSSGALTIGRRCAAAAPSRERARRPGTPTSPDLRRPSLVPFQLVAPNAG
jgi:hypothetical protein